jgi:putative hydrolase of the HAD superfamily
MIKGIIFDLDNSILDTHALGDKILIPILAPLNDSNLPDETKRAINAAIWHTGFEDLVIRYDLPPNIAGAMRNAYFGIKIPDDIELKTYGDEKYIKDLPVKKYLVSTGYTNFQRSKIDKSGIAPLFDEIIIDEMADSIKRKGKKIIFQEILAANDWDKTEALVVGDNPNSELGTAKTLGIAAVQTLRPGVEKWDEADYRINSLSELAGILNKLAY